MKTKKKSIWLSYDLGLKGNYSELFTFLDNHGAIDCGNGLAYLVYDNKDDLKSDQLIEKLKAELQATVSPTSSDRIYVIWKNEDSLTSSVKGKFLFGKRKTPIWNGYSNKGTSKQEDEAI